MYIYICIRIPLQTESQMLSSGTSEFVFFVVVFSWNLCKREDDFGCCDFVQQNVWSQSTCRSRLGTSIHDESVGNCREVGNLRLRNIRCASHLNGTKTCALARAFVIGRRPTLRLFGKRGGRKTRGATGVNGFEKGQCRCRV